MQKLLLCLSLVALPALGDEGMWTFEGFPKAAVQERYGVDISDDWLRRVQRSITRHESGCTGSFISPDGLVLTNHHCVMQCLSGLSSEREDLVGNGFAPANRSEERKCPTEMISVLVETENVTDKVNAATAGLAEAQANERRKQTLSKLEAECTKNARKAGKAAPLACEAVTLYQGGQYFLYTYKRYEDVRLAFAPHSAIAAFGGDPDNFNFPRWALDFSLLRVYENGKPAQTPDHLRWRVAGPNAGEPVFVPGHPGTTSRLLTVEQLKFQRDVQIPSWIARNAELRGRLIQFGKTGEEPYRISQDRLLNLENSLKVYRNLQRALLDDELFRQKNAQETALRERVAQDATLSQNIGQPWDAIAQSQRRYREIYNDYLYLESGAGFVSSLFGYARALVRAADERAKPNEQRLREYAESNLPKIAAGVLGDNPVYPQLEQLTFSFSLEKMREGLGPDHAVVRQLMSRESPESLAQKLVTETKLADAAFRKKLWDGGAAALAATDDPMIRLAREVDGAARAVRKQYEDEVQAPVAASQEKIAKARFAALGTNTYPDATFTLRISHGAVEGWTENGAPVEPFTRLNRLYERATGKEPFEVPQLWLDARGKLDPNTPFNFVTTNDIVGGNSGSPVIDAQGRLVGLAFDGNIHSIAGGYWYDARVNRAIAVHPAILLTALRDVYGAAALAQEIAGAR